MNKRDCEKLVKAAWRGVGVLTREAHMLRVLDALVSRLPDDEERVRVVCNRVNVPCGTCGGANASNPTGREDCANDSPEAPPWPSKLHAVLNDLAWSHIKALDAQASSDAHFARAFVTLEEMSPEWRPMHREVEVLAKWARDISGDKARKTSPEAGPDGQRSRPSQSSGDVLRALTTFRAWLMGEVTVEGGAFRSRRDGEGPYYWRTEARDRLAAIEAMLVAPHKPRISREVFNKCVLAAAHASIPDGLDIETQTRAVLEAAGMEVER